MKKNTSKNSVTKTLNSSVKKTNAKPNKNKFFIVGIGASAGGLEALKVFFDNTPAKSGMAFIIIQHLDPTHKSLLSELLSAHTTMKVSQIKDGQKVQPNCVYIIPPKYDLEIIHGTLELLKPLKSRSTRRPVDDFFHSLAIDQKDKAIGVVLSGTGTDGTQGLKEIKAAGGIAMVQNPRSAQFSGMPDSAIKGKVPDYILSPEKMPDQLIKYIQKSSKNSLEVETDSSDPISNQLMKIFLIIRNQTGYDFSNYKINTINRRIAKRMSLNHADSMKNYIDHLQKHPDEVELLYKDFLIGVTSFFRDEEVFKKIEKKVIPYLLDKCKERQELRLWVCGCSTGEEAYSLAILLNEAIEKNKHYIKITIFASDIDIEAIEFARIGTYSESALSGVSAERLTRYFIKKESGFQLKKEIRELIVFSHHNVIKDPPFSRMDLITCRNLLIYMNSELQKKIISVFHYSLNNEGILALGTSESLGDLSDSFSEFDQKSKIFKKLDNHNLFRNNNGYKQPATIKIPTELSINTPKNSIKKKVNISDITEKLLIGNYAPPSVVIDKNNDALYFSGNTGLFLEPPSGEARLNILEMAKRGLKPSLESAIMNARKTKSEIRINGIDVKVNEHFNTINLIVKPVLTKDTDLGALIIIFETSNQHEKKNSKNKINTATKKNKQVKTSELEKELKITREHLQIAINELETSNEYLQSTNEEYQSSNEELQSTNEELETSREELQSVNEELITVNSELQGKIEQLSQANDDLNNLLRSIEVATIFLDRNLKIKRFTPTATKIFNLIPSDIDRPVTHLSSNILYTALVDDVKNALKTLAVKSADVQANDGTWYQMRIIPYRTAENIIEGVLVTFVEISEQKYVEERLKKTNEHLNLIMENLPAVPFICVADPKIKISFVGKSCEKVTGFLPQQFIKNIDFWINRIHPDDKKKTLSAIKSISKKGSFDQPFRWKCSDGKYKHFINYLRYAGPENGRPAYIVGVWQEVQENKK